MKRGFLMLMIITIVKITKMKKISMMTIIL